MSYDMEIATTKKPKNDEVLRFLLEQPGASYEGGLEGNTNLLVTHRGDPSFTVDGPFRAEREDLPEPLAAVRLTLRWLIQIHIPYSSVADSYPLAESLALHLAETYQGAVYDSQADAIVWPASLQKEWPKAPNEEQKERIRQVELEWFLPIDAYGRETARAFLECVRRVCKEALPTRFGTYEPLQGRVKGDDFTGFMENWEQEGAIEYGGHFFWKAHTPCFGGHIFYGDRRERVTVGPNRGILLLPAGKRRRCRLGMTFDGRVLHADSLWREKLVTLFEALAQDVGAFYAAGYTGSKNFEEEPFFLQRDQWWCGIPPKPTWLIWFGPPYGPLVEPALSGLPSLKVTPEGVLLRLGDEPQDADQLQGRFPPLPPEILAVEHEPSMEELRKEYPRLSETNLVSIKKREVEVSPAAFIPDF